MMKYDNFNQMVPSRCNFIYLLIAKHNKESFAIASFILHLLICRFSFFQSNLHYYLQNTILSNSIRLIDELSLS